MRAKHAKNGWLVASLVVMLALLPTGALAAAGQQSAEAQGSSNDQQEAPPPITGAAVDDFVPLTDRSLALGSLLSGSRDPSQVSPTPQDFYQTGLALVLEASKEKAKVSGLIGFSYRDLLMDLKIAGPIAEGAEEAVVADLDGLVGSASVDFGVSWLRWKTSIPDVNKFRQVCIDFWDDRKTQIEAATRASYQCADVLNLLDDNDLRKEYVAANQEAKGAFCESSEKREAVIEALVGRQLDLEGYDPQQCTLLELPADSQWRDRLLDTVDFGNPISIGGRVKLGRNNHKWLDAETFEKNEQPHNDWSATAFAGVHETRAGFLSLNYRYQRFWKAAGKPSEICLPIPEFDEALRCQDFVVGAPRKTVQSIVQAEWRYFFLGGRLAVNPKISQEVTQGISGFELPFYFMKDTNGRLNGGVRVGWRSDSRAIAASFFVGAALDLIRQ